MYACFEETTKNVELLSRQARQGIKPSTFRLLVLRTQAPGHFRGDTVLGIDEISTLDIRI